MSDGQGAKPTVVLVHGAWGDGSGWSRVIPLLTERGIRVYAVQNPTTSLAADVAATNHILDVADGPVVLVGHSWGGTVITEAGHHPKVAALVYVAAFAPDIGQSTGDQVAAYPTPPGLSEISLDSQGGYWMSLNGWINCVAQDLPEAEASCCTRCSRRWAPRPFPTRSLPPPGPSGQTGTSSPARTKRSASNSSTPFPRL